MQTLWLDCKQKNHWMAGRIKCVNDRLGNGNVDGLIASWFVSLNLDDRPADWSIEEYHTERWVHVKTGKGQNLEITSADCESNEKDTLSIKYTASEASAIFFMPDDNWLVYCEGHLAYNEKIGENPSKHKKRATSFFHGKKGYIFSIFKVQNNFNQSSLDSMHNNIQESCKQSFPDCTESIFQNDIFKLMYQPTHYGSLDIHKKLWATDQKQ